ncbi:response regulator transcription factor [Dactylosporangium sp. CA-092794]|uniref:response regulator transcription factor n=1 Tax=Dactylosporangium sp. CA-092794 TaxID=3239929 RepID=UPI003D8DE3B2
MLELHKDLTLETVLRGLRASGLHPVLLSELSGDTELVVVAVIRNDPATSTAKAGWDLLTDRERTAARLAGQGLTNRQIARRMDITPHTVNFHLRQIFRKLQISSRVQLAAYAAEHPQ